MRRYDQTLFEDETENRMVEAKNLLEEMLQHPAFKVSGFSQDDTWSFPRARSRGLMFWILCFQKSGARLRIARRTGYFFVLLYLY